MRFTFDTTGRRTGPEPGPGAPSPRRPLPAGTAGRLLLALACLFVLSAPAAAETPSQLSNEALADQTRRAALEVQRLEAAAAANLEALRVIEKDLGEAIGLLREELPELPVALRDLETHDIDKIREEIARARAFLEEWKQRQVWATRARDMLDAAGELKVEVRNEHELLFDRIALSRALFIEAQRRLIRGDIDAERLDLPEGLSLEKLVLQSADLLSRRRTALADVDQLLKRLDERAVVLGSMQGDDPELELIGRRTALALSTIAEAAAVEGQLLAELAELPPETLPTEIERIAREWTARRSEVEQAGTVVDEQRAALDALLAERSELRPPVVAEDTQSPDPPEVRAARREVELSGLLIDYYDQDLSLIERINTARVELLAAIDAASDRHAAFSRQTARLFSVLESAEELEKQGTLTNWTPPEGMTRIGTWDAWRLQQPKEAERRDLATELQEALREASLDELRQRATRERESLEEAETLLATELSYAEFVSTMQERTSDELVALLAADGEVASRLATIKTELVTARTAVDEATVVCRRIAGSARALETPYSRKALRTRASRLQGILDELVTLTEGDVLPDRSADLEPTKDDDPRQTDKPLVDDREPIALAKVESERIADQQRFSRVLVRYYDEVEDHRERWAVETAKRKSADEVHVTLLRDKIRELKLRYAAALELRRRFERGELAALPDDMEALLDQTPLAKANEELRDVLQRNASFLGRSNYELQRLETLAGLREAVQQRTEAADERAELIGSPVSKLTSAMTSIEDLDDVDASNLRYEAAASRSEEMTIWDHSMKRFMRAGVIERFEMPLTAYHLELQNTLRVERELTDAEHAYGQIVAVWEREIDIVTPLRKAMQATLALRLEDYHLARYAASVAQYPGSRKRIEEGYRQTYGKPLTYRLNFDESDTKLAAELLFGAEMRLVAERALAADLDEFLSKLGAEQEIGWYEAQSARIASLLEVQEANEQKLRELIDKLMLDYRKRLNTNTVRGLSITVIIPIVAFLLVRLIRRLTRRFETEITGELGEDEADRRRRLRTIARTTTAALSVLLWVIALIYIFAQLGLDVTPIIASASVVGLAVAFGAQTLIKDYFYGFFILIENQFTVGDIVKLGPITGTVEQISLRITTLRDLKGTVHYIPNGSIGQVSNLTQGWSRVVMEVSVPHDVDPDRACEILHGVLGELYEDPAWRPRILEHPVVPGVENLTEIAIDVRLMIKVRPGRQWEVAREARRRIKQRFAELGINVPYPHRVIHHLDVDVSDVEDADERDARLRPASGEG